MEKSNEAIVAAGMEGQVLSSRNGHYQGYLERNTDMIMKYYYILNNLAA